MSPEAFRKYAHQAVDWMADYLETIEQRPVKTPVKPGDIAAQLPKSAPLQGESMDRILNDFKNIIVPGMTHWQHPAFFAYFPANASPPSLLAEMLCATLAAQCMSWQTSPAATELETRTLDWLRQWIGLPTEFCGVIQDTASTATLCAVLAARETLSDYHINQTGLTAHQRITVYCSQDAHSSVDKAVAIAGIGKQNLRKIPVNAQFALQISELQTAIEQDLAVGYQPICVIATLGTTSVGGIDPLKTIGQLCRKHNIWLHVDAAWAGSALILPEYRWMIEGIETVDSLVFNPHKWLLTQFDCSAFYVRDAAKLTRTFEILPEYLKTREDTEVINYRDWGIALGRRFRALKLWFVLRSYGLEGLQTHLRKHIEFTQSLALTIKAAEDFEELAPPTLGLLCFRYHPQHCDDQLTLNRINEMLLNTLNQSGELYLTHTKIDTVYALRMAIGGVVTGESHVKNAWNTIQNTARAIMLTEKN